MPHHYTKHPTSIADRFWPKVERAAHCWPWRAGHLPSGYGVFSVNSRSIAAHRVAWALSYGPIPTGRWVLHYCDGGANGCVRPGHLYLGDHAANTRDMVRRRRWSTAAAAETLRSHPERRSRGTLVNTNRLSETDVLTIRARCAAGETQSAVARAYSVHVATVHLIVHRRNWKWLP